MYTQHSLQRLNGKRGIALLMTILLMSILLTISASLLNITLKQYQFASIGLASEQAFQAANAGLECLLWHDYEEYPDSKFDVGEADETISCMGDSDDPTTVAGVNSVARTYQFNWGSPGLCSEITVYKFNEVGTADGNTTGPDMTTALGKAGNCSEDVVCTVIRARGYNVGCGSITTARTIEREITQRF